MGHSILRRLICCTLYFTLSMHRQGLSVELTDNWGTDWCVVPGPPLRIIEAFKHDPKGESLEENDFTPTRGLTDKQYKGTTVFTGCNEGYTATNSESVRNTCVSNGTENASWSGTFPTCRRNVCWWLGSEVDVEARYGDHLLADQALGFPEGSTINFKNWTCPIAGEEAMLNESLTCQSNGKWKGNYPVCVKSAEVPHTESTTDFLIPFFTGFAVGISVTLISSVFYFRRRACQRPVRSEAIRLTDTTESKTDNSNTGDARHNSLLDEAS